MIALVAVVEAVTVAVLAIVAALAVVTAVAVAIASFAVDADLQPLDTPLDAIGLLRMQAVAGRKAQALLNLARVTPKPIGLALAQDVPAVEMTDLALQLVDPHLEAADLAPVIVIAVA